MAFMGLPWPRNKTGRRGDLRKDLKASALAGAAWAPEIGVDMVRPVEMRVAPACSKARRRGMGFRNICRNGVTLAIVSSPEIL